MTKERQGSLCVVAGAPGVGKTTIAAEYMRLVPTKPALLDKDTVYGELVEAVLHERKLTAADMEGAWYDRTLKPLEYDGLFRTAKEIRSHGCDVVLSAPFSRQVHALELWSEMVHACGGGETQLLWVHVPLPTLRERLISRGEKRNEYAVANFDAFVRRTKADEVPVVLYTAIDNGADGLEHVRTQLTSALSTRFGRASSLGA